MEKREEKRRSAHLRARIITEDGEHPCVMIDVSAGSARLNVSADLLLPTTFIVDLTQDGRVLRNCELVHQDGLNVDVRFMPPHPTKLPVKDDAVEI